MAVNVSTITSVCLYCQTNSDTVGEKDFHEIYNEVGLELQLPSLVETFFHIKVKNDGKKYLCDDCVNRLIELYDLEEHAKEQSSQSGVFEISKGFGRESIKIEEADGANRNTFKDHKVWNLSEVHAGCQYKPTNRNIRQNDPKILHKSDNGCINLAHNDIENFNQSEAEKSCNLENENAKDHIDKIKSVPFKQERVQDDSDIVKNGQDVFVIRNEDLLQDFNTTSASAMELTNTNEQNCIEHIEFIEDDEVQNLDIEIVVNRNINTIEELELKDCQLITNAEYDYDRNVEEEYEKNNLKRVVPNNSMEDVYEEELEEFLPVNSQTDDNQTIALEDIFIEAIDDIYYGEVSTMNEENEYTNETNSDDGNENSISTKEIQNIEESVAVPFSSCETQFNITDDNGTDQLIDNDEDECSNNSFFLEEEYLIEETRCSQEYDNVDLNEYLDTVLVTNFQDLLLNWETECKICLEKYNTFEDLLKHSCIAEFEEEQNFCCTLKDCEETVNNLPTLARHLILKHCDKLKSIPIYGKCPDCQKNFSNLIDFNKHSCCRSIKRKTGSPNYCQYCDMDFQSLKRYVFHMQFHLTNRRPKICLLCGALFNNSNDFFEHTQYQHIPKTALACIKCDRFFKEKDVFESHMELHIDSKYLYACTLCPKKYTNKYGLCQHKDIYHNNKANALRCAHCEKEFVNKTSYRNHVKCHSTDVQVQSFICSRCGIITSNMEFIKYHVESDENSHCFSSPIEEKTLGLGYTCENCSLDFLTIKQLKQHRLSKNHNDDLFHCVICRQVFKSLRHMRNHCINHNDFKEWQASFPIKRFFVCNIGDCQEFYPIWTSLYYHKKRPHKTEDISISPKDFKCQFCHQLCSSKMSLAVHVARSHNNSNVKCSHCNRSIKTQKLLQEHIDRYHTPVECDICFKKFKHRRNLESHNNMVHLNIKRYFCKYCEKGYFHKSERDIHEKKVHPETPYKCELCNFITNYPESLKIHMDKHNNQLKFKCKYCSKAFGRKQPLQFHLKRHLNKREYCCAKYLKESGCKAAFLTHNLLKKHIKSKHPFSDYNINMQTEKERKEISSKSNEFLQTENISFEILDSDDDSKSENSKTSTAMRLNDADFDEDDVELVLESDVEFVEQ